jgi:hypothetical protein
MDIVEQWRRQGRLAGTWAPARKFFTTSSFVKYLKF